MTIVTVGSDLAKKVFAVHGVDATGKPVLIRPSVARTRLAELMVSLPPCLIGMEACSGAHHWARLFATYGHTVRLMAPKFVTPYRLSGKRGKNDAADAAAICEAVTQPNMRFVSVKSASSSSPACSCTERARATVQELLGRSDASTTMIYTHVPKVAAGGAASPLDLLSGVRPERIVNQRP